MKKNKFVVDMKGSEHRKVEVTLEKSLPSADDFDRIATVEFFSDGMDIKLYMMESDLRIFARDILSNTSEKSDD